LDAAGPLRAKPPAHDCVATLVGSLASPAAEVDRVGLILAANQAFCALVARSESELRRLRLRDLLYEDDRRAHPADLQRWLGAERTLERAERYTLPDGSRTWLATSVSMFEADDAPGVRFLVLARDISAEKEKEEQLKEGRAGVLREEQAARRQAEQASRLKDEFLALLSHELRSPLGAILMWLRLLQKGSFSASESSRALAIVERSARSLESIVEDLLHVSRISAGKFSVSLQPLDLATLVDAAADAAEGDAALKGLTLSVSIERRPVLVRGDPLRLQQAVSNLLSNAVKFTSSGGRIGVCLDAVADQARVRVTDNGAGMSADFLPLAFERFRQQDSSSTRSQRGLGLGLYIVRHVMELHGGSVTAESPGPGMGSTFTILLPLMQAEQKLLGQPPDGEGQAESETLPAGLRVLVVDDEGDTREALRVMLEQKGATVITAGSAAEAFAELQRSRPDVLLSDIAMPGEDGFSLIRRVRALPRERGGDTPAAAVTAYAGAEDRRNALHAGFQHHVAKPIDQDRLFAVIGAMARKGEAAGRG
jgi:PAS domain S-box-containing protein